MTRSTTTLLLSAAVIALAACGSSKGPGALGTKDDIVVRNNGLPGATAPVPPSAEGEIAQVEAAPTPEVAQAPLEMPAGSSEPAPVTDPAVEQAAQKVEESKSPVAPTTTTPINDDRAAATAPTTETVPADVVAAEPVAETANVEPPVTTPAPANNVPVGTPISASDNTYVPNDAPASAVSALNARKVEEQAVAAPAPAPTPYQAPVAAAQPIPAPVEAPAVAQPPRVSPSSVYPAEDYPPEVLAQAQARSQAVANLPQVSAPAVNFADPEIVKMVQASLKAKGVYGGKVDGVVNTQYLNALSKYQGLNKLPQGGLNLETLRLLGVVQ